MILRTFCFVREQVRGIGSQSISIVQSLSSWISGRYAEVAIQEYFGHRYLLLSLPATKLKQIVDGLSRNLRITVKVLILNLRFTGYRVPAATFAGDNLLGTPSQHPTISALPSLPCSRPLNSWIERNSVSIGVNLLGQVKDAEPKTRYARSELRQHIRAIRQSPLLQNSDSLFT